MWYKIFYWLTVADGVKSFFDTASNIFTTFAVLSFIAWVICSIGYANMVQENRSKTEEEDKTDPGIRGWVKLRIIFRNFMYPMIVLACLTWLGYVLMPTKRDALVIIAGGAVGNFITSDSSAKVLPAEVMTLLRDKVRAEIKETNIKGAVTDALNDGVDTLEGKSAEELREILRQKQ